MTYADFARELKPLMDYFGPEHFPALVIERLHYKLRDLNRAQLREVLHFVLDNSKFAPKVPDFLEYANLVRAKAREGGSDVVLSDDGPRTPEVAQRALATLKRVLGNTRGVS